MTGLRAGRQGLIHLSQAQGCISRKLSTSKGSDLNAMGRTSSMDLLNPIPVKSRGKQVTTSEQRKDFLREDIPSVKRVVIKVGTSVLTRDNEFGVSLTRLASLVEQVSALVHSGKEVIIVTSGAVGFGKMRLQVQNVLSQTVRNTLSWGANASPPSLDSRACAAAGQSGLMTLYDAMFSQYGVSIAQLLVTMSDFQVDAHRANMCETIKELIKLGIVPVCNENDVFYSNTESREFIMSHQNTTITSFNPNFKQNIDNGIDDGVDRGDKVVRLTANDSLSALLAVELDAQLMIVLSNVDGLYTAPPGRLSSMGATPKLLHTFNPDDPQMERLEYGRDRRVGRGGMAAKVDASKFALNHGVHCILANGHQHDVISKIFEGRTIGTLFTRAAGRDSTPYVKGTEARSASREMAKLPSSVRKKVLEQIVKDITRKEDVILAANNEDLQEALRAIKSEGAVGSDHRPDQLPLSLSKRKLRSLVQKIDQMTATAGNVVGRNVKWCKVTDGLYLEQETVPIGVALCVFDKACPDVVPLLASLCIASGNAVIFKSSRESFHTTQIFHSIIISALKANNISENAVINLEGRDNLEDFLVLQDQIDMVIPRGCKQLIEYVNTRTKIPVLGDTEGLCHVYVHNDANLEVAARVLVDSKCEASYAGRYGVETILVHSHWIETGKFEELLEPLTSKGVALFAGPRLRAQFKSQSAKMPPAWSLRCEYGSSGCAVEVVDSLEEAIQHVNDYGSHHTDVIVCESEMDSRKFSREVDSACVFQNCSTRFSEGYSFGLGTEVGVTTKRVPMRGPIGIEGLMTSKYILRGKGHAVADIADGKSKWVHEKKCVTCGLQVRD
uniref:Delta-1-pyrroline-5-carboxylate synthase n=1 Tax=Guillardia theta TaxID=55529 RepID=A0A7S4H830_GUITH